jgi:5-methyltetrahydropteroyltriglutamate--homocysteine methyltransferase
MITERTAALPPFYTHGIGSLPRPQAVRDVLVHRSETVSERADGALDDMVRFAIRVQEEAGLDVVTDGEWRRVQYVDEFLDRIGGFEPVDRYEHQGEVKFRRVVVRRLEPHDPVFARDAQFLRANTGHCTKFALPSPFLIAIRYWKADYSGQAYPTYEHFLEHLAEVLAREAQALAAAGIDIVQLDDPALTYFCDRKLMAGEGSHDQRLRRSWDVQRQFPLAVAAINRIVEGLPAEVHLHCCHSVYKRRSDVTGDYKPILPLLRDARVDRVNLEFAYHQTGDISDLQLLPAHLRLGMGVVDVRSETLQPVAEIERLAAAGAEIVGPGRIALNPDCGFAPNSAEPPTLGEAYEKLKRLVQAARNLRLRLGDPAPKHLSTN